VTIGVIDVGAAMGFGHDGDDGYARGGADGFGFEVGEEMGAVGDGNGLEDVA
jgi:hypothetical protein